ncbi:hypothetical protein AVDCRST_MAG94-1422 [uncultured Leptolyngbya sp.]|uniref:Uncharacterized protein n=1 Tax=uncultured Leptolyngbya sp. TaxID=332963 RepID=A0A6J4L106_9CYAN|nr:hypothetical protein AVDCRST_MAG94-1422 [uncultured Leptolyngbya sp.]
MPDLLTVHRMDFNNLITLLEHKYNLTLTEKSVRAGSQDKEGAKQIDSPLDRCDNLLTLDDCIRLELASESGSAIA